MATPPNEEILWQGSTSQLTELWFYVGCILSAAVFIVGGIFLYPWAALLALLPALAILGKWLVVKSYFYEITSERIKMTRGIFSKITQELELYRVRDTTLIQPFFYRLFGRGNIVLNTTDATTPVVTIECIPQASETRERLRNAIEQCRDRKRVRYAELGGEIQAEQNPPAE